jgi:poly(hydroxyalkanoate) granule-associated protein
MATVTTQYKKFQGDVLDSAHKIWLAGLGTVKTVGDESTDLFNRLVERGKDVETRGKKELASMRKELKKAADKASSKVETRVDDLGDRVDRQVTNALHRIGVPSRDEIKTLTHRVEELSHKVDRISATPARTQKTVRKVFHVAPHEEGWKVQVEGEDTPASLHDTKDTALNAARETAKKAEPSQVIVHKLDGTIQTQFSYGDDAN